MRTLALLLLLQIFPTIRGVDLNRATKAQIVRVDGITPELADRIIKGRPYNKLDQVQALVGKEVWEKIKTKVVITYTVERVEAEAPTTQPTR